MSIDLLLLLQFFRRFPKTCLLTDVQLSDPIQFPHKLSVFTRDAVSYIIHTVASSFNGVSRVVRLVFLGFADTFDSLGRNAIPWFLHENSTDSNVLNVSRYYFLQSYPVYLLC